MLTDLRFALRMLIKSPGFTIIAVLTLALGIGANSAIFSVIDSVLLRPLPFKDPSRIVMLWNRDARSTNGRDNHSFPDYADFRDQNRTFSALAAYSRTGSVLTLGEESQPLEGVVITSQIFDVLGIPALLGRGFTSEEDKPGAPNVIVLTHGLWQRAFGSDPKIIGQQIVMMGRSYTVLGVMPPGWKFPVEVERIDYLLPLEPALGATELNERGAHFLSVVGRLKPGVPLRQVEADTSAVAARLAKQYPDTNTSNSSTIVVPLHDDVVDEVRPALLVLLAAVLLVLLIACANVANLPLRAAAKSRFAQPSARVDFSSSASCCARVSSSRFSVAVAVCSSPGGVSIFSARSGRAGSRIWARSQLMERSAHSHSARRF